MDSPANAKEKIRRCGAHWLCPSKRDREQFSAQLRQMQNLYQERCVVTRFYGKSPLVWDLAMRGRDGYCDVAIAPEYARDRQNPWSVFYWVDGCGESEAPSGRGAGCGVLIMRAHKLAEVIAPEG